MMSALLVSSLLPLATVPSDFARGAPIELAGPGPLHVLTLTEDAYATCTSPQLDDLRVFNAAGEEVPYALEAQRAERVAPSLVPHPVIPLMGRADERLEELMVKVERQQDGALVSRVRSKTLETLSVRAYLVDLGAERARIEGLEVDFEPPADGFLGNLEVMTSDELTHFRPAAPTTALAALGTDGSRVDQRRVHLHGQPGRYVRLAWSHGSGPVIRSVAAVISHESQRPARVWSRLELTQGEGTNTLTYAARAPVPLEALRLALPVVNTVARVTVGAAATADEHELRHVYGGLVYRIERGGLEVATDVLELEAAPARLVRLTAEPAGGGLGARAPTLDVGWTPKRVLFVARGAAPFRLAYGSANVGRASLGADELGKLAEASPARLGVPIDLGGHERLTKQRSAADWPWHGIALWATIVVMLALLGFMALRLSRQLGSKG